MPNLVVCKRRLSNCEGSFVCLSPALFSLFCEIEMLQFFFLLRSSHSLNPTEDRIHPVFKSFHGPTLANPQRRLFSDSLSAAALRPEAAGRDLLTSKHTKCFGPGRRRLLSVTCKHLHWVVNHRSSFSLPLLPSSPRNTRFPQPLCGGGCVGAACLLPLF